MKTTIALLLIFFATIDAACSRSADHPGSDLPALQSAAIRQSRQHGPSAFRFYITLSKKTAASAQVDFTTVNGTALAGRDFTARTGTLVFTSGSQTDSIDIQVSGDSLRQADQQFSLQFSHPVGVTLSAASVTATIVNTDNSFLATDTSGYWSAASYPGYHLAWSDEFNDAVVNTQNWNFETGNNGWGNHELENYTGRPQNVFESNGNLIIEARKENLDGSAYTSARITTQGKRMLQYGRIDMRAKLPVSPGMWPALWMLGSNINTVPWPACGEIDIMELIGKNPMQVVGSYHWKQANGQEGTINNVWNATTDFSKKFHVFSLIWEQNKMQLLVDDQPYVSITDQSTQGVYPFNDPFFLIFNVAVGGDWPGPPDDSTVFPQRMFVDYVRFFQK